MGLKHTINAFVYKGESRYVAECFDISVVTQGSTLDETVANLQEAVALHLEGEDPAEFGLAPNPTLVVTLEVELAQHALTWTMTSFPAGGCVRRGSRWRRGGQPCPPGGGVGRPYHIESSTLNIQPDVGVYSTNAEAD